MFGALAIISFVVSPDWNESCREYVDYSGRHRV